MDGVKVFFYSNEKVFLRNINTYSKYILKKSFNLFQNDFLLIPRKEGEYPRGKKWFMEVRRAGSFFAFDQRGYNKLP